MSARSPEPVQRAQLLIEQREWSIASDITAITPIVETVQALCVSAGFSARQCRFNIPLAMTEALSNAILCGNGNDRTRRVQIAMALEPERLVVDVTDEGNGFDMQAVQHTPDEPEWLEREDGRGLFLMRSLMDSVESLLSDDRRGHTLRLILHRP